MTLNNAAIRSLLFFIILSSIVSSAGASIINQYTSLDEFEPSLDVHREINFTGMYTGTIVTTNFSYLGIRFWSDPVITYSSRFTTDGMGLSSRRAIQMDFSSPINAIGFDSPGNQQIYLYLGSNLVGFTDYTSPAANPFQGVIATSFDRVLLRNLSGGIVEFDNIHFGTAAAVPIPAAVWLFGSGLMGLVGLARRKKT
ncbi:MAG: hypothetical protein DIZ80_03265 [endosymbiont of Galathealinum brachiosum]|uniref:VPLPA-CTERM sorting domain-containing protein n=1 Tax=endosymbiont of Galathealinum brachiosum TaxID=2200906 RepID=A0A370DI00_9GAMM|nr:MAG: hypothetical protein DIZ80_03265 [endosymbiont of Galathealinum brachiosum]